MTAKDVSERILCAAIHFDDGKKYDNPHRPPNVETGIVVCGHRHPHCFAIFGALAPMRATARDRATSGIVETQGFLTSSGRFVNRADAAVIARAAHQTETKDRVLYSEDLY